MNFKTKDCPKNLLYIFSEKLTEYFSFFAKPARWASRCTVVCANEASSFWRHFWRILGENVFCSTKFCSTKYHNKFVAASKDKVGDTPIGDTQNRTKICTKRRSKPMNSSIKACTHIYKTISAPINHQFQTVSSPTNNNRTTKNTNSNNIQEERKKRGQLTKWGL